MAPTATPSYSNYEVLSADTPKSIVWASTGGDGSGKSYFGLTAPEPIFVCAFDPYGMNRVSRDVKVRADGSQKDIRIARYGFNPREAGKTKNEIGDAAVAVWDRRFKVDFSAALKNSRTILIDREDLAWELLRFARFGGQSDAPKEYGDLNIEYAWLAQEAMAAGVNLGFLRGIREKWVSKFDPGKGKMVAHNTGEMIPDGMKKVPDFVDVTLAHAWDESLKSFVTKIGKFTNKDWKDDVFPDLTFPAMAALAYPETSEEDWQ